MTIQTARNNYKMSLKIHSHLKGCIGQIYSLTYKRKKCGGHSWNDLNYILLIRADVRVYNGTIVI